jgi:hypothetical protein
VVAAGLEPVVDRLFHLKGHHMLKGLALTPPAIGRISIGRVVEKNGKRLPEKDDEFTITSQVQTRGGWAPHPIDETLRRPGAKLRSIPVRLLFDDPELNLRANYSLFDRTSGRPICVGNGETCKRSTASGVQTLPCASPDGCELAFDGGCKPYGRLNVRIGDEDELGSFVFRTTGYNSIRTLAARLQYLHAISGGMIAALPLELRLRGKSTTQSHRAPIYYVDLTTRTGMSMHQMLEAARTEVNVRQEIGFDQAALDDAARAGFAVGAFEESEEEGRWIVEEFAFAEPTSSINATPAGQSPAREPLAEKLTARAHMLVGGSEPVAT